MNKYKKDSEIIDAQLVAQSQLSVPAFDMPNAAQALAGHLSEALHASPGHWEAVDHIKVTVEPIVTHRIEMTVIPRR